MLSICDDGTSGCGCVVMLDVVLDVIIMLYMVVHEMMVDVVVNVTIMIYVDVCDIFYFETCIQCS